ncbi:MAG TPA: hypothetical protein DCG75_03565 [Bacteroidales bacterium]|nr:hypothetical protein [Bacteroidales bacterium]
MSVSLLKRILDKNIAVDVTANAVINQLSGADYAVIKNAMEIRFGGVEGVGYVVTPLYVAVNKSALDANVVLLEDNGDEEYFFISIGSSANVLVSASGAELNVSILNNWVLCNKLDHVQGAVSNFRIFGYKFLGL